MNVLHCFVPDVLISKWSWKLPFSKQLTNSNLNQVGQLFSSDDPVLVHQPAELDEHSMRVGVLLLRAVELLEALGGPLEAQAHAMQEPPYPPFAGTDVESLCVEPFVHEALESYSTQAQDVGDAHDVLAEPRHVS